MTRDEAITIVSMVAHGWPGAAWETERMEAYVGAIESYDAELTTAAVMRAQKTLRYRPSIAELREFVALERKLREPDDDWRHQPLVAPPRPSWVPRWERARAAGDWRPFPEQVLGMEQLARQSDEDYRVFKAPNAPTTDGSAWVLPAEYLEGETSSPGAIVELPDVT